MWWGVALAGAVVLALIGGPFVRGPAILAASIGLIIWLHKRNFDRTNQYGVESYKGFGHMMAHRTVEGVLSLVAWIGAIAGFILCYPYFAILVRG